VGRELQRLRRQPALTIVAGPERQNPVLHIIEHGVARRIIHVAPFVGPSREQVFQFLVA
jgi:hypothetical protein